MPIQVLLTMYSMTREHGRQLYLLHLNKGEPRSIPKVILTQGNKNAILVSCFSEVGGAHMVIFSNTIASPLLVQALLLLMVLILVPWKLVSLPNASLPKVRGKIIHLGREQENSKNLRRTIRVLPFSLIRELMWTHTKFKEDHKSIIFLTYKGAYVHTYKMLNLIQ